MSGTKTRRRLSSIIVLLLATGIIVMVNLFIQRHFSRLDLTEEKQYTLSEPSRKAMKALDDTMTVTVYISKDLPAYMMNLRQSVVDILQDYQSYSGNRMLLKFVSPEDDEETQKKLAAQGIQKVPWRVIDKDKAEVVNGYFGITLRYKDRQESIPVVSRPDIFEYTMTATVLKVSATEVKTIGFLKGHEEYDPYIELGAIGEYLEKQYRITLTNLEYTPRVPPNVDVLVIARPKEDLADYELFALDQFLMHGGSMVVLREPIDLKQNQLMAEPISTNLDDLLQHYGVRFGSELLLDRYNSQASFNMGRGMFMTLPYPFWIKIVRENMDADNPALTNIAEIMLPWTTWLEIDEKEGVEVSKLLLSSEFSWTQPAFNLNPQQQFVPPPGSMRSRIVAARLTGRFTSNYKDMAIPRKPQEQRAEGQPPLPEFPEDERLDESSEDGVLLVVGNARFVSGEVLRMSPNNVHFLLNSLDQMAFGDDLIKLRARGIKQRGFDEELDEKTKSKIKFLNLFGMPILILLFALVRGMYRRARRSAA